VCLDTSGRAAPHHSLPQASPPQDLSHGLLVTVQTVLRFYHGQQASAGSAPPMHRRNGTPSPDGHASLEQIQTRTSGDSRSTRFVVRSSPGLFSPSRPSMGGAYKARPRHLGEASTAQRSPSGFLHSWWVRRAGGESLLRRQSGFSVSRETGRRLAARSVFSDL
jgi:hypothetical protein